MKRKLQKMVHSNNTNLVIGNDDRLEESPHFNQGWPENSPMFRFSRWNPSSFDMQLFGQHVHTLGEHKLAGN